MKPAFVRSSSGASGPTYDPVHALEGALTIVPLKVVHLAQSDTEGGANCAAYRLHSSLLNAGLQSIFHCGRKFRKTSDVVEASSAGRVGSKIVAYFNARPATCLSSTQRAILPDEVQLRPLESPLACRSRRSLPSLDCGRLSQPVGYQAHWATPVWRLLLSVAIHRRLSLSRLLPTF